MFLHYNLLTFTYIQTMTFDVDFVLKQNLTIKYLEKKTINLKLNSILK